MAPGHAELAIGQRVRAIWQVTQVGERGDEVVEPAFAPV
jgi:hypothetical protein